MLHIAIAKHSRSLPTHLVSTQRIASAHPLRSKLCLCHALPYSAMPLHFNAQQCLCHPLLCFALLILCNTHPGFSEPSLCISVHLSASQCITVPPPPQFTACLCPCGPQLFSALPLLFGFYLFPCEGALAGVPPLADAVERSVVEPLDDQLPVSGFQHEDVEFDRGSCRYAL